MPKRGSETIEDAQIVHTVDNPKKAKVHRIKKQFATSDAVIQSIASKTVLGHALMWEYTNHVSEAGNLTREVLESALKPIDDLHHNTLGVPRLQDVNNTITTFWGLHSKYLTPSGTMVRRIYTDILMHVVALYQQYGDDFLQSGSKQEQAFVRLLAEESVPPEEAEKVADNGILETHTEFLKKEGFSNLCDEWLKVWGNIPSGFGPLEHRINMDLNEKVYFRHDGLLALSIRLIGEFIERLRHPPPRTQR